MDISILDVVAADDGAYAQCRHIRHDVFCIEQQIPESLEWDEFDATCHHFLLQIDDNAAATARSRPYGANVWKVERVAVLKRFRGQGLGALLMRHVLQHAKRHGAAEVVINAQLAVEKFYTTLGFVTEGPQFVEADIPHVRMRLRLK